MSDTQLSQLDRLIKRIIIETTGQCEAETLSRPALLKTDGSNLTYAVDCKVSAYDDIWRNVTIASATKELCYADPGSAVTLHRNHDTGKWEVIGFAKRKPGWRHRYPVDLDTSVVGPAENVGLSTRVLTLGELKDYAGGFGFCPFGAFAIFKGSTLIEVRF